MMARRAATAAQQFRALVRRGRRRRWRATLGPRRRGQLTQRDLGHAVVCTLDAAISCSF